MANYQPTNFPLCLQRYPRIAFWIVWENRTIIIGWCFALNGTFRNTFTQLTVRKKIPTPINLNEISAKPNRNWSNVWNELFCCRTQRGVGKEFVSLEKISHITERRSRFFRLACVFNFSNIKKLRSQKIGYCNTES